MREREGGRERERKREKERERQSERARERLCVCLHSSRLLVNVAMLQM